MESFLDGQVELHHGDCLDVLRELPSASVDSVVTDPPYSLSFLGRAWDTHDQHEDAGFAYWLTGLIDGEGHFAIKQHTRGTHAPAFSLKLRSDERGTLEHIQRQLGIGTLTDSAGGSTSANPMSAWVVQSREDCQRLVDLLDKYPLRAKKQRDYQLWAEAVCEWTTRPRGNRWHGVADQSRMSGLRTRLMEGRAYIEPAWSGNAFQDWCRDWATEAYRVLKPGGYLVAFGGTRTYHRMVCGAEDAGFEVRDSLHWIYGTGFAKSLDVARAVDALSGTPGTWTQEDHFSREGARPARARGDALFGQMNTSASVDPSAQGLRHVYSPGEAGAPYAGQRTAVKPAHEPILLARKALEGTVAANVLEHGTGGLRVGACTLPPDGRWPTNVLVDEEVALSMGERARFFPCFRYEPKPTSGERPDRGQGWTGQGIDGSGRGTGQDVELVAHPTLKPVPLMRWLARLVTPVDGTVLDMFAGSGTTAEACLYENLACILIEREASYLPLIRERLSRPIQPDLLSRLT